MFLINFHHVLSKIYDSITVFRLLYRVIYTKTLVVYFHQTWMNVLLIMVVAVIFASTLNNRTNANVEMDINCTQMEYLVLVRYFLGFFVP